MKQVETAIKHIEKHVTNKQVLEIACGCAELSIAASRVSTVVNCIDLDSFRLNPQIDSYSNITFQKMDATCTEFEDESFDCIIAYNAIAHLQSVFELILNECRRLIRPEGHIFFISSWSVDKNAIQTSIIPQLESLGIHYYIEEDNTFIYLRIRK